jgi:LDH2 family malate/lactate/ureidoglycolate dehydrogenase
MRVRQSYIGEQARDREHAMAQRYAAHQLVEFTTRLFESAGLDEDKAATTATLLVEADLMGHTTHGLQLAGAYLGAIEAGRMARTGAPEVVADRGPTLTWDGCRLPGVWLTAQALAVGVERARRFGIAAVAIRRSAHIGCLAAYLPRATEQGCMAIIASSDPSEASVAPFGGTRAVVTPDPIAAGIPTEGDPILVDISASISTNGMTGRYHKEGRRLPGRWVMDAKGNATDDPAVLFADPPGTILPIGGTEYGHKGFGLALLIEALTQGLGGFGRVEAPPNWGAAVFVQVLDPEAFGGLPDFVRQTEWLAQAVRNSPPAPDIERVRVPGDGAMARRRAALANGVELYPGIIDRLASWADKLGVALPQPI